MFSPYYAWSGRHDPLNHCALNVALYGPRARWAMTERGRTRVTRTADQFAIAPSLLAWNGDTLTITIDERAAPVPRPIRGIVRVQPELMPCTAFLLDADGRHTWQPVAPRARVVVDLEAPRLRWSGSGYLDANFGSEPLENAFASWTWSRAHVDDDAIVFYDASDRAGAMRSLALQFTGGDIIQLDAPAMQGLPRTWWGMTRATRADEGAPIRIAAELESAPFYTRSILATQVAGQPARAFHESLSLDRVRAPWVRALLPFRMPRVR